MLAACAFPNGFTPEKPVELAAEGATPPKELESGGGPLDVEAEDELHLRPKLALAAGVLPNGYTPKFETALKAVRPCGGAVGAPKNADGVVDGTPKASVRVDPIEIEGG